MQPVSPIGTTHLKCRCFKASPVETGEGDREAVEGAPHNLLHRSNRNAVRLGECNRTLLVDKKGSLRLNDKCRCLCGDQ